MADNSLPLTERRRVRTMLPLHREHQAYESKSWDQVHSSSTHHGSPHASGTPAEPAAGKGSVTETASRPVPTPEVSELPVPSANEGGDGPDGVDNTSSALASDVATTSASSPAGPTLPAGAIAGITAGSLFGLGLLVLLAVYLFRRRRELKNKMRVLADGDDAYAAVGLRTVVVADEPEEADESHGVWSDRVDEKGGWGSEEVADYNGYGLSGRESPLTLLHAAVG